MTKRTGAKEALFITSMAAGFVLGAPMVADASNKDPAAINNVDLLQSNQVLRYGYTGYSVRILQLELKNLNLYKDSIDGIFGPKTQAAVKKLQIVFELKPDGVAGSETIIKLNEIKKPKQEPLSFGDTGPKVVELQQKLNNLNYYLGNIDGIFGPITKNAVESYQHKYSLKPDGIAGPITIEHVSSNKNKKGITIAAQKAPQQEPLVLNESVQNASESAQKIEQKKEYAVDTSIISVAKRLLGVPYVWGGTTTRGFDCSGFIQYVFAQKGITIPRTVSEMWNYGVPVEKPSIGDVIFFETYKPGPSHAGIYIGDGMFAHTDADKGVAISKLSNSYWKARYLGAKRVAQFK